MLHHKQTANKSACFAWSTSWSSKEGAGGCLVLDVASTVAVEIAVLCPMIAVIPLKLQRFSPEENLGNTYCAVSMLTVWLVTFCPETGAGLRVGQEAGA